MSPTLMTRPRQIRPPSLTPWSDEEDFYNQADPSSLTPWKTDVAPDPVPAQPRAADAAMPMEHGDENEYPIPPQGLESPPMEPEDNPYFADPFDAPIMPTAPNPFEGRMKEVMDKRTAHAAARPDAGDKQYARPWWQRFAMAAANGAAGYVNAGGRARAATISPDVVASRPKYDAAMEDWRTQGEELSAEAQALQMEDSLRRNRISDEDRARRIRSDQDRATAYMENQRAQAARAARLPVPKTGPAIMNTAGGALDLESRTIIPGTGPAPKLLDPETEMKRVLIDPKSTPAQRAEAQRNLAVMRKPGGGGTDAASAAMIRFDRNQSRLASQADRKELADLEQQEYGQPELDRPGLHELRSSIDWATAGPAERSKYERATNQLANIYKRKRDMGAITPAEYDQMMANLKPMTKAASAPASAPAAATASPAKPRRPLSSY